MVEEQLRTKSEFINEKYIKKENLHQKKLKLISNIMPINYKI